ncbi:MAG TPA: hypothetical protein VF541_16870 [Longimicrobium sp.]
MNPRLYASAAALAFACARPAFAQDTIQAPPSLAPGRHALSFAIPQSGETTIGGWVNLTARSQLGLEISGDLQDQERDGDGGSRHLRQGQAHVGVALRRFVPRSATVAPFVGGSVFAGGGLLRVADSLSTVTRSFWDVGASVGVGVEWFPVAPVSVGGMVGARAVYQHGHDRDDVSGGHEATENTVFLSTATSSLSLKIYF